MKINEDQPNEIIYSGLTTAKESASITHFGRDSKAGREVGKLYHRTREGLWPPQLEAVGTCEL